MRLAVGEFGAMPTAAVRVAIAALVLMPLVWLRGLGPQLRGHWKPILIIGLFTSVFTAVTLTRMWVAGWLHRARPSDLAI